MRKNKYYIYIFIFILFIGTIAFYAWHYHDGISSDVNDWGAFTNYFNGFLSPFLAIINIVVFVELKKNRILLPGYFQKWEKSLEKFSKKREKKNFKGVFFKL